MNVLLESLQPTARRILDVNKYYGAPELCNNF